MAYKVIILYQLYMPSYFLGTFTEYPCLFSLFPVFVMRYPNQTLPIRRPADIAPVAEDPCAALSLRA